MDNVISLVSALSCAVIFVHAVCQTARVQHRALDCSLWLWALLAAAALWAGAYALVRQPSIQEATLNVAVAGICARVAYKVWRGKK